MRTALVISISLAALASGQNFVHPVANLERAVPFYSALGLKPTTRSGTEATFEVPGASFAVKLTQARRAKSAAPNIQDPGAPRLVISVRDLARILRAAMGAGATMLTPGGAPLPFRGGTEGIAVRDADGLIIELLRLNPLPATTAAADSNVIGGRLSSAVSDLDRSIRFYRDVLGLEIAAPTQLGPGENVFKLFAAPANGLWRYAMANVAGSSTQWELAEFKNVPLQPYRPDVADPGAAVFSFTVPNVREVLEKAGKSDAGIIGESFLRDPDGILIELRTQSQRN